VLCEGQSVRTVALGLDLTETGLRDWVKRARADRTESRIVVRDESARLRKREPASAARATRGVLQPATSPFDARTG
jgi:hypothetical protein